MPASVPAATFAPGTPSRRARAIAVRAGCCAWLVYLLTAGGTLGTGDAVAMFDEAGAIVSRHATDVPASESQEDWRGVDGRYYTPFGIGQPLFDVPFVLAGRAVVAVTGLTLGDPDAIPKAAVALATTIPAGVAVGFGFLIAWRLSSDARASLLAAFALAFGTLLWPYAKFGFNAALATAALAGGAYGFIAGEGTRRGRVLAGGGAALGLAILTRNEMVLAALVALGWLAWRLRADARCATLWCSAAAGVVLAVATIILQNTLRFGTPFEGAYSPALATSFAGARAFLVSPSAALLLFSPIAIVAASFPAIARRRPAAALLLAVLAVMAVFYSLLEDWLGTRSYGPRYLVPLLPLAMAPLALWWTWARERGRLAVAGLLVLCGLSVAVQLPAVTVDFARAGIAAGQPSQSRRRDAWRWSPLWINARVAATAVPANIRYFTGRTLPPLPQPATGSASLGDRLSFSLDFWWLYLVYLHVLPRAAAILLVAALGAGAWITGRGAWRLAAPGGAG